MNELDISSIIIVFLLPFISATLRKDSYFHMNFYA